MSSPRVRRRTLPSVLRDFERWRGSRSRGRQIPDRLWDAAAELAREHGVSKVSRELGLDYYALKKRMASGDPVAEFVEVPMGPLPASPECVMVLEGEEGARLRVELRGVPARALSGASSRIGMGVSRIVFLSPGGGRIRSPVRPSRARQPPAVGPTDELATVLEEGEDGSEAVVADA